MADALRADDVTKVFNRFEPNEVAALKEVSLSVEEGEMVAVEGPSGSGKTTLLSLFGCMSRPTSGRIFVGGEDVSKLNEEFLAKKRRQEVGVVFQALNLVKGLTAVENVELPAIPTGEGRDSRRERAGALLERFGLGDRRDFGVEKLSGGERQRVALARGLINDPGILVADEPTAHLDRENSMELLEALGELKEEGRSVVVATHDPLVPESGEVDRVEGIREGELV